jgi:hypothetical protein
MNTPVNFELAKLLKEKGFDEPCSHAYKEVESPILYVHQDKKYNNSFKKEWQNTVRKNSHMDNAVINRYSAPTIAEVVMWLYEKHDIWITINPKRERNILGENYMQFDVDVWQLEKDKGCVLYGVELLQFKSPSEAYEAAIEYTLKNLI